MTGESDECARGFLEVCKKRQHCEWACRCVGHATCSRPIEVADTEVEEASEAEGLQDATGRCVSAINRAGHEQQHGSRNLIKEAKTKKGDEGRPDVVALDMREVDIDVVASWHHK